MYFGPSQFLLQKYPGGKINGHLGDCIPLLFDENITSLSKVDTSMKQGLSMFIRGLDISHHNKSESYNLKNNSSPDRGRVYVGFD